MWNEVTMVKSAGKLKNRLEELREASQLACERIIKKRSDIVAVYVVGSVARGNVHWESDIDMVCLIKQGGVSERERIKVLDCSADVFYFPIKLWKEEFDGRSGSDWEIEASSVVDSLVLHDPNGFIRKAKEGLLVFPEERRRMNTRLTYDRMTGFSEAVGYHYMSRSYDIESIFSKLYAMEALRILFPLNRVYLKDHKRMFEQLEGLPEKPLGYVRKCLGLLRFKSQDVKRDQARRIINDVWKTKRAIKAKMLSLGL